MGQEFLENLWGWQVTRPDLVQSWAWDEVKSVLTTPTNWLAALSGRRPQRPRQGAYAGHHDGGRPAWLLARDADSACVAWAASWPNWWRATACPAAATPARITPCGPGWPNNYPPTTPRRCRRAQQRARRRQQRRRNAHPVRRRQPRAAHIAHPARRARRPAPPTPRTAQPAALALNCV